MPTSEALSVFTIGTDGACAPLVFAEMFGPNTPVPRPEVVLSGFCTKRQA